MEQFLVILYSCLLFSLFYSSSLDPFQFSVGISCHLIVHLYVRTCSVVSVTIRISWCWSFRINVPLLPSPTRAASWNSLVFSYFEIFHLFTERFSWTVISVARLSIDSIYIYIHIPKHTGLSIFIYALPVSVVIIFDVSNGTVTVIRFNIRAHLISFIRIHKLVNEPEFHCFHAVRIPQIMWLFHTNSDGF